MPPLPYGMGARSAARASGVATVLLSGHEPCSLFMRKGKQMPKHEAGIFSEHQWAEIFRGLSLPSRQAEIVRCLFRGCGDKQIAAELKIAVLTVRTYLGRLFGRLDVQDRCELILHVVKEYHAGCCLSDCPRLR